MHTVGKRKLITDDLGSQTPLWKVRSEATNEELRAVRLLIQDEAQRQVQAGNSLVGKAGCVCVCVRLCVCVCVSSSVPKSDSQKG